MVVIKVIKFQNFKRLAHFQSILFGLIYFPLVTQQNNFNPFHHKISDSVAHFIILKLINVEAHAGNLAKSIKSTHILQNYLFVKSLLDEL